MDHRRALLVGAMWWWSTGCSNDEARSVTDAADAADAADADAATVVPADAAVDEGDGQSGDGGVGDAAGGHCAPGDFVSMYDFPRGTGGLNRTEDCYDDDYAAAGASGLFTVPPMKRSKISSVALATPMEAGKPYAGSLFLGYRGPEGGLHLQIWGTEARCGAGASSELLLDRPVAQDGQVECFELLPGAAYSHWLVVLRYSEDRTDDAIILAAMGEATFCPHGSCR